MVDSNVRKKPIFKVDMERAKMRWTPDQLCDVATDRSGYVPNRGDEIMIPIGSHFSVQIVNEVDYEKFTWTTLDLPPELDGVDGNLDLLIAQQQAAEEAEKSPVQTFEPDRHEHDTVHLLTTAHVGEAIDLNNLKDPGALARARLKAKRAAIKTGRFIRFTIYWAIFLALVVVALIAAYGKYTMEVGRADGFRNCSMKFGDGEITGVRHYSYQFRRIFGQQLVDETSLEEETYINLTADQMTIIGLYKKPIRGAVENEDTRAGNEGGKFERRWWAVQASQGDRGRQIVKKADTYTFVSGKKVGVVTYDSFCR